MQKATWRCGIPSLVARPKLDRRSTPRNEQLKSNFTPNTDKPSHGRQVEGTTKVCSVMETKGAWLVLWH